MHNYIFDPETNGVILKQEEINPPQIDMALSDLFEMSECD